MRNGFVVPPILIWIGLITVILILGQSNSSSSGLRKADNASIQNVIQPTPIPKATSVDLIDPVKNFYTNLSAKHWTDSWQLLSKNFQNYAQGYEHFVAGYKTTKEVKIKDVSVKDPTTNTVDINFEATDIIDGKELTTNYSGQWKIIWEDGKWKLDSANIVLISKVPPPTPKGTPQVTATHDGSRTGSIIKYHEYAKNQEISVYENELLPYTIPGTGVKIYLTQGDITWFKNNVESQVVNLGNNTTPTGGYPGYSLPSDNLNILPNNSETYYPVALGQDNSIINVYGGASYYTQIGDTVWGSDGSNYSKIGNTVWGSEGPYTQIGNTTWGPDGSYSTQIGNTLWNSDGSYYTQIGNTTWGSDGSSYTRIGNTLWGF